MKTLLFRRIGSTLLTLTLALGAVACDSKEDEGDKGDKQETSATSEEPDKSGSADHDSDKSAGLGREAQNELRKQYENQAEQKITPDNAQKMAEQLEKEIEGDTE